MTSNRVALRGTRNPTSKPIVWTALNAHGSHIGGCQWNAIASRFGTATFSNTCQSAFKFDPVSASNFDPFERRVLTVALASSELAGIAETRRARGASSVRTLLN